MKYKQTQLLVNLQAFKKWCAVELCQKRFQEPLKLNESPGCMEEEDTVYLCL